MSEVRVRALYRVQHWITATRLRTYLVIVLLSVVPLALFLYSSDRFLRRDTTKRIGQQSVDAVSLVADRFDERFTTAAMLLESFATRPSLVAACATSTVEQAGPGLRQVQDMEAGSDAVALYGRNGELQSTYPAGKSAPYKALGLLSWYRDSVNGKSSSVSDILQAGSASVVAVATPMRDANGQSIGVLAVFFSTDVIRKWTAGLGRNSSRFLFLVDRQGNAVAAGNLSLSVAPGALKSLEPVQHVIAGRSGGGVFELSGKRFQAAYKPIGKVGWGVVIALPFSDVDAAVSQFERPLALIALVFLLIALGLGSFGANLWRRVRDSERQTRTVIDTAHDGFIAFDDSGIVTDWNHQAETIFGWTRVEAIGSTLRELVMPERYRAGHLERLERFRSTGEGVVLGQRIEMTAMHKSGREFPVEASISPVQIDRKHYFNAFVRDITDQKQHQLTIEQKNRELDLRNREVERANQLKSQFLASMSHELRTPLNAILGFSDLLTDGTAGSLTEKQSRWVDHIRRGGKHLLQLINDILDLAKIEAGQVELEIESFGVNSALPEVISNIRQLAMTKRITLEIDCDSELRLEADRLRFKQILYNLLSNAVKFTPEGGSIRVEAGIDAGKAKFTVTDSGVGIRAEDLGVIFDEFRQVGETTRGVREGTGLGLAITKRLVEQQGGSIHVESKLGEGTRFTFTVPASKELTGPVAEPVMPLATEVDRPLVLVVDDEPAACELLASYLSPEGYATSSAHSGVEALDLARRLRPSCVTLDVLMPSGSGWETLHELRRHPETQDIPIIVVSVVDKRRLGMALGASDYLIKPIEREALLRAVERHVRVCARADLHCVAADDDPVALRLMADVLLEAGFSVGLATNGHEAMERMRTHRPDLLLLDLMMPEMDGFEVVRQTAEDPTLRDVPIVVLTGKDLTQQEIDLLGRTTQAVFRKDGEWRVQLINDVRRVIGQRAAVSSGRK